MKTYQEHAFVHRLAGTLRFLEDVVNVLSGPLISLGFILTVMDLLSGNGITSRLPWMTLVWAGCIATGVDAQLVATSDRFRRACLERRWGTLLPLLAIGILLCHVAFIGAVAYGLQESLHIGEAQALGMFGLTPVAFQIERAVLTVSLVVYSGMTRPVQAALTHADRLRDVREQNELAIARAQGDVALAELQKGVKKSTAPKPKPKLGASNPPSGPLFPTGGGTPLQALPTATVGTAESLKVLPLEVAEISHQRRAARARLTLKEKVYRALDAEPGLTKSQIAKRFRCSESRASALKREHAAEREGSMAL